VRAVAVVVAAVVNPGPIKVVVFPPPASFVQCSCCCVKPRGSEFDLSIFLPFYLSFYLSLMVVFLVPLPIAQSLPDVGIVWEKPMLDLFPWSGTNGPSAPAATAATSAEKDQQHRGGDGETVRAAGESFPCCDKCPAGICPCPFCGHFPKTNILFEGTSSVAIFDDGAHEKNTSRRFKAWGNLAPQAISKNKHREQHQHEHQQAGSRREAASVLPWKAAQQGGIAVSANGLDWIDYKMLQSPSFQGRDAWRFDAQASMFFDERRQKYIGTNRAFRPCDECGLCPIWWQPSGGCQNHKSSSCTKTQCENTVRAVGAVTSEGSDFMSTNWSKNVEVSSNPSGPQAQYYSQVTWPFYNIYLGIVMIFDAVDPPNTYGKGKVHCELQYTTDLNMATNWTRISPGVDFVPLGIAKGEGQGAWDSHICFASGNPLRLEDEVRIYYMGGDGCGARFSTDILHSRMPLVPTPARLKLLQACDQWYSSRVSTASYRCHRKFCPNSEGLITRLGGQPRCTATLRLALPH
jgi:hypothetical protein